MTARTRLPDRRPSATFDFAVNGLRYTATVSYFADGRLGEISSLITRPTAPPTSMRATLQSHSRSRSSTALIQK